MSSLILYTNNILENGTVTVTGDPDTGCPESRLCDRAIDLFWKDTVTEAKTFQVDYGSAVEVDTLIIERHNFDGQSITWDYSTDAITWTAAVTGWTQSGNGQIVKTMSSSQTKRYWRVTVSSMTDPKCSEIYMTLARSFPIKADPPPEWVDVPAVQWNKTFGGTERSTRFGEDKKKGLYTLRHLDSTAKTSFRAAMNDLNGYSKPFYIKDHESNYRFVRFLEEPPETWTREGNYVTPITLNMIEV